MNKTNVLITGATGMIGQLILKLCLEDERVGQVISLVRRPTQTSHVKLQEVVVEDFLNLDSNASYFQHIDTVYYCLGVYTGAVKPDLFRAITVDYPTTLGKLVKHNNPSARFVLLSGQGADRNEKSRMMFARDKGAAENKLESMAFGNGFYSFRPGYIYPVTPRKEPNLSYRIFRWLYPLLKNLSSNASVTSQQLAKAMFVIGIEGGKQFVYENSEIVELV